MYEDETTIRVKQAQAGDADAFDWLVHRFQDRAVAYASSILGDIHLAQDASQSAFVDVFLGLSLLRDPKAFPAWLKKIIFKHCDRTRRGFQITVLPLANADQVTCADASPERIAERHALQDQVGQAIDALPEGERQVIRLFYMGQHSHREIAEFLGVPTTTVKSRLYEGRLRLRERMMKMEMVQDSLYETRPSRDEVFSARVNGDITKLLSSVSSGQNIEIKPGSGTPAWDLMASILIWAIEGEISDVLLVPEADTVSMQFRSGSSTQQMLVFPKWLQAALTDQIKMASDLELGPYTVAQDGLIPIRYRDLEVAAFVSFHPTPQGDSIDMHFVRK